MKDTNTSTTEQHNNDCLLGQGTYTYTPICQCNACFVDPEDDTPEQPYQPIETMTEDEYWESFTSNDRPW